MKKAYWNKRIKKASKDAGTYAPYFDSVIDTLAGIMETRDEAIAKYNETGRQAVVEHTNKGGNTNIVKNPALVVIDDLNRTALAYWRDLGLTPAGLKKLNTDALKSGTSGANTLSEALKGLGI